MSCSSPTHMGYQRIIRFAFPLLLIFLFLYLSISKLPDTPLYECIEDGKPCAKMENDVIAKEEVREKGEESFKEDSSYRQVLENSMKNCKGKNFQIGNMMQSFHECVTGDNEILLEQYLDGWRELIKFMDSMGSVFSFISHETMTKINILQGYLDSENGMSYKTIKSMITYELEHKVVNFEYLPTNRVPSGCRTLLRMHRALKWLEVFLYKVGISPGQGRTSEMCAEAYHKTLSHYHSWFIRQVAEVAFLALPPLEEMYKVVCVRDHKEARVVLLTTVDSIVKVYNITQELYTINNMLDLP
ncbi:PREDICTED: ceramide-1-phosphate transfer protein-like [Nanorana parkeri]|uniref:ceramide-1-phosphate transfer protein-like n=1 Tax=Nanorana parkeri TaxID=125878 RepID=UPI000854839C|nr:PREDICTED: ceramide-1-phosphate transfer protein-like [Nanorana parkeri]